MKKAKEKAAVRLAQEIVQAMYDAGMRPGDRYFSEAETIKRHGVARATLREALRFLEAQGVITIRAGPGGGSIVGQPDWIHLASTLGLLLQFHGATFRQVLEARSVIEPGMAELAARNATPDEIEAMAEDLNSIEARLGSFRDWSEAYNRFWRRLAESTHNAVLGFLSPALRAVVQSPGFAPNEIYRVELLERMRAIHAAVAGHDPDKARLLMSELENSIFDRLSDGYPRVMERQVAWSDLDLGAGDAN